ncbi:MAG TPA: hypothetical protein VLX30_14845 [Burkholderiales bacterium]|nr:hypothetical protein [Burkholderiales bacterium]
MIGGGQPGAQDPAAPRASLGKIAARLLLHGVSLLVAAGCFAAYAHFKAAGSTDASLASLVAAAGFGFAPLRDVLRIVFAIEGKALHLAHGLGGLALLALPLTGVVSGAPLLTHAAMAPFAIMGAAQAVMHQDHPRNAKQAAALQRFAASLPEVAQFAGSKTLASPGNAQRAVAALSDILSKAQALGETELESDPGFQSALRQVSTRFGANLGLDAVDLALARLAANPATASAVPGLRKRLAQARSALNRSGTTPRKAQRSAAPATARA